MARSRADRLAEAISILEKTHGKDARVKSDLLLDQLAALLLAKHVAADLAVRAVKRLYEDFVDWNEIRISYVRELVVVLEASGVDVGIADVLARPAVNINTASLEVLTALIDGLSLTKEGEAWIRQFATEGVASARGTLSDSSLSALVSGMGFSVG